jgi:general secretion pathway protein E
MVSDLTSEFSNYLRGRNHLAGEANSLSLQAHDSNERTFRKLWELSELSANDFADKVAEYFKLPRVGLPDLLAAPALAKQFSPRFLREMSVFPYRSADGTVALAVADPSDSAAVSAAAIVLGNEVNVSIASFEDIETILNQRLIEEETTSPGGGETASARDDDIESLRDLASGAPVVRAVSDMFEKAVELRASDIHIEPFRTGLVVRMRVDGLLRNVPVPANVLPQAIISRVKILAGLNIAERRLPQDGAARIQAARSELDLRVAIMPTTIRRVAVIRLLPKETGLLAIESSVLLLLMRRSWACWTLPHGMIVVTGPTGSGKTTTLATVLSVLNESTRKILTIEDPVEYELPGINQTQAKPAIGLTFAMALRAFVRQDPDVIMVGEIRDPETAEIAIHAALTGHLVLTTLHTETAAAAVPRLLDLGVQGFLLKSTLRAVIAQRLVRQLCDRCKTRRTLSEADFAGDPRYSAVGLKIGETIFEPGKCERCGGTGYRGRVGVFEVLQVTEEVRHLINLETDSVSLDKAAMQAGMTTMIEDGVEKCRAGMTSPAEILRVTTIR